MRLGVSVEGENGMRADDGVEVAGVEGDIGAWDGRGGEGGRIVKG